jgi:hypothetical protein
MDKNNIISKTNYRQVKGKKGKAIPVTGQGGP